jgi:hypothetical protein
VFRKELAHRLEKIFGLPKTTFDQPSESYEQDVLFVDVTSSHDRVTGKKICARAEGFLTVFAQVDKLPFGFFTKRIEKADPALTADFFFYDVDTNPPSSPARRQNIQERRCRFVFLHSEDYDPNKGRLNDVKLDFRVSPLDVGDGRPLSTGDGTIVKP